MKLNKILNIDFPFLNSWKSRLLYLIVTLTLCAFSILGLEVFNLSSRMNFPHWISFLGVLGFLLAGLMVMALSQVIIGWLIKGREFKLWHLITWLVFEIIAITFVLTFIYGENGYSYLNEWLTTFRYAFLILTIPYSFSILLVVVLFSKEKQIYHDTPRTHVDLFHFVDERNQIKLSIKRINVLYIESTDNYVTIFYREEENIKHELIRNSLKRIESEFIDKGLLRCHRSFIVNIENVESLKKEGRGYKIKLKDIDQLIPVSRGYTPSFTSLIIN